MYDYMNMKDLLDDPTTKGFPKFDDDKHSLLCPELKLLYVAITRATRRLWICESSENNSKPMFDYWNKMSLIQVKELDNAFIQAMHVGSGLAEWKSLGEKVCLPS